MFGAMEKKTLAIVGCGKLAAIVIDALNANLLTEYQLIATYSRTGAKAQQIADKVKAVSPEVTCNVCNTLEELLATKPDYIVETASPDSLKEFAVAALTNGSSIVTLSIGAFADSF